MATPTIATPPIVATPTTPTIETSIEGTQELKAKRNLLLSTLSKKEEFF
jgi:hypothetical protein